MLRHTSIHTYNIPKETNPLSGYVLCVWGEHGRTRPLNTPGGAQRECRQPLFSTLQHAAHKHSCPSHGPFVPYHFVDVAVIDAVGVFWTYMILLDEYGNNKSFLSPCYAALIKLESLHSCRSPDTSHLTSDAGKHAYACRHRIIANVLKRYSDN